MNRLKLKFKLLISSLLYFSSRLVSRTKTWLLQRRRHWHRPPSKPKLTPPSSPASRKPRLRRLFASTIKRQELNQWNHRVEISAGVKTETHEKPPSTSPEMMNFQKTRSTGSQLMFKKRKPDQNRTRRRSHCDSHQPTEHNTENNWLKRVDQQ